jgi:UDP-2,3-diacylglucosamine hydrolase
MVILFEKKTGNQTLQLSYFGHRHLPMKVSVGENSEYVNLGDWITYFTYGVFDEKPREKKSISNQILAQILFFQKKKAIHKWKALLL